MLLSGNLWYVAVVKALQLRANGCFSLVSFNVGRLREELLFLFSLYWNVIWEEYSKLMCAVMSCCCVSFVKLFYIVMCSLFINWCEWRLQSMFLVSSYLEGVDYLWKMIKSWFVFFIRMTLNCDLKHNKPLSLCRCISFYA